MGQIVMNSTLKKVLLLNFFVICFAQAVMTDIGVVDHGNPIIFRQDEIVSASVGVRVYAGDKLYLNVADKIYFDDRQFFVQALKDSKIAFKQLNEIEIMTGSVYLATKAQSFELFFDNSSFEVFGKQMLLEVDREGFLKIANLNKSLDVLKPLALHIDVDEFVVFNGGSFSLTEKYQNKFKHLEYPFHEVKDKRKKASTTFWLSAILPGLGHFYVDSRIKGTIATVAALALLNNLESNDQKSFYFLLWSWSILDSLAETSDYNEELMVKE